MTDQPDRLHGDDVPDAWRECDETLRDDLVPFELPEDAKAWVGEQRFMHGLLRALHTADAAAREGRIEAVLARIDHETLVQPRRRWWLVTAAALVLATLGFWVALPARLPTAEAAVERAVAELARDVNRRFHLETTMVGANGKETLRAQFSLVTRPGKRFRVEGKVPFLGEFRIGSDGTNLWMQSTNGFLRRVVPLAERERLMAGFGEVLDLGYLDVHELVHKLPDDFDLRVVGREVDGAGRSQLRIEAHSRATGGVRLKSARLLCDEVSGMVTDMEVETNSSRGLSRRLHLQYLGEEPAGLVDYSCPF